MAHTLETRVPTSYSCQWQALWPRLASGFVRNHTARPGPEARHVSQALGPGRARPRTRDAHQLSSSQSLLGASPSSPSPPSSALELLRSSSSTWMIREHIPSSSFPSCKRQARSACASDVSKHSFSSPTFCAVATRCEPLRAPFPRPGSARGSSSAESLGLLPAARSEGSSSSDDLRSSAQPWPPRAYSSSTALSDSATWAFDGSSLAARW
mmetsp:Transcript_1460/g.4595  ORF Transcript_1460/g.4595 Transcript_1460/m.4595 type:complete len:211 (-) Transcript_1460:309-941(-)